VLHTIRLGVRKNNGKIFIFQLDYEGVYHNLSFIDRI